MKKFLIYVWLLPQNLLGLIVLAFQILRKRPIVVSDYKDVNTYFVRDFPGGVSLGRYIILNSMSEFIDVKHEYGHCRQSKYLGPFYLVIVGIPSILHAWIYGLCGRKWNYYSFPTEKSADRLGEVKR